MGESTRPLSFYNPLSANKHAHRTNLPLFAIGWRGRRFRRLRWASSLAFQWWRKSWNCIERSLRRAVVPQPLPFSATTFPTALSLCIVQGRLRKGIRYPSCGAVVIWKTKIHQLGLLFLLEAYQQNVTGRSTAGWLANAKLQLLHRQSSICRSHRSSAKLFVLHVCVNQSSTSSPLSGTNGHTRTRALESWEDHAFSERDVTHRHTVEVIICMITCDFKVISMTVITIIALSLSLSTNESHSRRKYQALSPLV